MSRIVFRPWSTPQPANPRPLPHPFSAGWDDTKDLLRAEVDKVQPPHIRGDNALVVIEVDTDESSIRQDGFMRADRKVRSDGVVVSFESKHGPLRYECNAFYGQGWRGLQGWQANVRAVALALSDLRRVDRYGIGRRGEQYAGWKAIGSGIAMPASSMTVEDAARLLVVEAGMVSLDDYPLDKMTPFDARVMYRRASKKHHPDVGGDPAMFDRIKQAHDLLTGAST